MQRVKDSQLLNIFILVCTVISLGGLITFSFQAPTKEVTQELSQLRWDKKFYQERLEEFSRVEVSDLNKKEINRSVKAQVDILLKELRKRDNISEEGIGEVELFQEFLDRVYQSESHEMFLMEMKSDLKKIAQLAQEKQQMSLIGPLTAIRKEMDLLAEKSGEKRLSTDELNSLMQNVRRRLQRIKSDDLADFKKNSLSHLSKMYRRLNDINLYKRNLALLDLRKENTVKILTELHQMSLHNIEALSSHETGHSRLFQILLGTLFLLSVMGFLIKTRGGKSLQKEAIQREQTKDVFEEIINDHFPFPLVILGKNEKLIYANNIFFKDWNMQKEDLEKFNYNWSYFGRFMDLSTGDLYSKLNDLDEGTLVREVKVQADMTKNSKRYSLNMTPFERGGHTYYFLFFYPLQSQENALGKEGQGDFYPAVVLFSDQKKAPAANVSLNEVMDKIITHFSKKIQNYSLLVECELDDEQTILGHGRSFTENLIRLYDVILTMASKGQMSNKKLKVKTFKDQDRKVLSLSFPAGEVDYFQTRLQKIQELFSKISVQSNILVHRKEGESCIVTFDLNLTPLIVSHTARKKKDLSTPPTFS